METLWITINPMTFWSLEAVCQIFLKVTSPLLRNQKCQLYFSPKNLLGIVFFDIEETKALQSFFWRAKDGFKIVSDKEEMALLFLKLRSAEKLDLFLILLKLLKIGSSCEYQSLSPFLYDKRYSYSEGYRMGNIFEFTMNNFNTNITLEEVSDKANMTKNAFCKYFKKPTNKTYF